jgi:hypothetical protein
MTESELTGRPREKSGTAAAKPASDPERQAKAQQVVAYLSYALADVRALSPTGSFLLEMSIVAINEDMDLSHFSLDATSEGP